MTPAPVLYTPAYCEAIRQGCQAQFDSMSESVKKIDSRIFAMLLVMVGNLLAAVGALTFYLITRSETMEAIKAVQTIVQKSGAIVQ